MLPKDYKYQLPDLHVWLVENGKDHGITCEFDDHHMALGFYKMKMNKKNPIPEEILALSKELMSKHQLIASGPMGKISAIQGGCSMGGIEIYCLDGDIFKEIRRYGTVEAAGKTIISLLTTAMFDETVSRQFDVWNDFMFPDPEGSVQEVEPPDFLDDDEEGEEWKNA